MCQPDLALLFNNDSFGKGACLDVDYWGSNLWSSGQDGYCDFFGYWGSTYGVPTGSDANNELSRSRRRRGLRRSLHKPFGYGRRNKDQELRWCWALWDGL